MPYAHQTLPTVERSYTIAFAMRSGSNEICNLLARNGFGAPSEFFQGFAHDGSPGVPGDKEAMAELLSIIATHTHNGVFGSKMACNHRARVDALLRGRVAQYRTIDDFLPNHRWIWLIRRDKIAQAISLCRAEQSGVWAAQAHEMQAAASGEFDFYHIMSRVMMLSLNDLAWKSYFERRTISPYIIYYEEFFDDLSASLWRLIEHLGGRPHHLDSAPLEISRTFEVQRDEVSKDWAKRFRDYLDRVGDMDMALEFGGAHQRWSCFFFDYGWRPPCE